MQDEAWRLQIGVFGGRAIGQLDPETAHQAMDRIVTTQSADTTAAQRQREQGLVGAEILDRSDLQRSESTDSARARWRPT